jgi:hypothetical protein
VKVQLENFLCGLYEVPRMIMASPPFLLDFDDIGAVQVLPPELLSVFDYQELDLLLCGVPEIDVRDWMDHTEVGASLIPHCLLH